MATSTFTGLAGGGDLSNSANWEPNFPGSDDIAIIDSDGLAPSGQALAILTSSSFDVAEVELVGQIEMTNVTIDVSHDFSVSGFAHFASGSIVVNTGSNTGNFEVEDGQFLQDGQTVTINAGLVLGFDTNSSDGTYGLGNGGTLHATYETIGGAGTGLFQQGSGANDVAGVLTLAQGGGSVVGNTGTYQLTGGTLRANIETIGDASTGEFDQSNASSNQVNQTLTLGNQQGSSGSFEMADGSLSVGGNVVVGFSGEGTFDDGGGTVQVAGSIVLAVNPGSEASYHANGGATLQSNALSAGLAGDGEFDIQSDTEVDIATNVNLGMQVGGNGTLEAIGPNGSLQVKGALNVGVDGSGHLNLQAGGAMSASSATFGQNADGSATADIADSGSQLTVTGTGNIVIASAGAAQMTVENGGTIVADRIIMASQSGSKAQAEITGSGTVVHATHNSSEQNSGIVIGANGSARILLADGAVMQSDWGMVVGGNGAGEVAQTGGAAIISGNLVIASNAGSSGLYQVTGGTLQANSLVVNSNGELDVCGGSAVFGTVTMAGGTFEICDAGGGGGKVEIKQSSTGGHISFSNGAGTLQIDDAADFDSAITGFHDGDLIDFADQIVVAESFDGSNLSLTFSDNQTVSIAVSGDFNSLATASDGNGGSLVAAVIDFPQAPNSNVDEWLLKDGVWIASAETGSIPSGYQVMGVGDFIGDGTSDILWQNTTTGDTQEWLINNGAWAATVDLGMHPGNYQIAGVGDFTGNGTDDVLWTSTSGGQVQTDIWELNNGQWAASVSPGSHPAGYQVAGIGDWTDGILWYNSTTGDVDEWQLSNGQWAASVGLGSHPANATDGSSYQIAGIGDFTGNGIDDVLWTSVNSNGTVATDIWELGSNGEWANSVSPGSHPAGYQVVGIGDFTGNGTSDILWQNPTTGDVDEWLINNGKWAGSVDLGTHPGNFQIAGIGDFTGSGTSDIFWHSNT